MAKRRTTKKTTRRRTSRRRSVGAINPAEMLTNIGGVLVGVAAAGYLNKLALKNQSETIQAVVPIAMGIVVPMVMKNELGKFAGAGLIAYGGAKFLQKAGLAGLGDVSMEAYPVQIGANDISVIAGDDDFAMAGDDDFAMAGDISVLAGLGDDADDFNDGFHS